MMTPGNSSTISTKTRLLTEAEKLFAEHGFNSVSVRTITQKAKCNLGAINYHFGGKENLYKKVFIERWVPRALKIKEQLEILAQKGETDPEKVIYTIATTYLDLFNSKDILALHHKLIIREIINPSEVFELVLKKTMLPTLNLFLDIMEPHIPSEIFKQRGKLIIFSIFSQILYFNLSRHVVTQVTQHKYDDHFKDILARHLTEFSLHGLLHLSETKENGF